jgi:LysR family transcriptional regulator, low CO2-responsive transcriptional regulator
MRQVTIRQLQIFAEAAQTLSFARVAERLHLTPSAVSFQIKQIEIVAGFPLFERIGKKVKLTQAGDVLLVYARQVLRALLDADQTLTALKGLDTGKIAIGVVTTSTFVIPHILARFQSEHPGVAITLHDGNRRQVLESIADGSVDLAIMGQPPEEADVFAEPFAPHPSVIVASPQHPLAARTGLSLANLAHEPFVVREDGSGTRSLMDRHFPAMGLRPRIVMVSSSNNTIKQAVMAGMGLALISRHTIGLELRLGLIAIVPIEGFPLMRSWFVVQRRSMPALPMQAQLRQFLLERGQTIIEELDQSFERLAQPARL